MKIDIQETINRLRELDKHASPVPWGVGSFSEGYNAVLCEDGDNIRWVIDGCYMGEHLSNDDPDLEIIVEARNVLPALLDEIERLTTQNKNLEEAWEDGYADAICDVEGVYEFDRAELTKTPNPYKENNK